MTNTFVTMYFDLVVIGAGSGGVRAARLAASCGKRVALIEDGMMGGSCVNVGCIPKKLYVNAGLFPHYQHLSEDYGWRIGRATFSLADLRQAKDQEIQRLRTIYRANAEKAGVSVIDGRAVFLSSDRVLVGSKEYRAKKFLITTGSTSTMPQDFPGIELAHNSDAVFNLDTLPKRVLVYGGGYIAVELAGVLARLGSKVELVYRGERLLKQFDPELTNTVQTMLQQDGVTIQLHTRLQRLESTNKGVVAITDKGTSITSDFVLFALGRHANIANLGLELAYQHKKNNTTQLQLTPQGFIQVEEDYQTSIAKIYALGDVIGTPQLTPLAIAQAMDFHAKHYAPGSAPSMPHFIPTCVFTQPPLGTVGVQEAQLRKEKRSYSCFSSSFTPLHLTLGTHTQRAHVKILVEQATDLVVGVHLLAEYAGEIIQTIAAAMECGITKAQLDATLAIHPTIAEELVTNYQPSYSWSPNDNT